MEVVKTLGKGMVPRAGVEPARPFGQRILSPQRLPFRHPGLLSVTRIIAIISCPKTPIIVPRRRCGKDARLVFQIFIRFSLPSHQLKTLGARQELDLLPISPPG